MNKTIIAAAILITFTGLVKAFTTGKGFSRVLTGGYVFLFLLAIMEFFGGFAAQLAAALAMLAVATIVLYEIPWTQIFQALGISTQGSAPK